MDPVEIPPEDLGDPVAINDQVLLQRERERLKIEAELRRLQGQPAEQSDRSDT